MMQIIFTVLSSLFTILIIMGLVKGKKYNEMVENLDNIDFFLKDLYIIGYFMSSMKLFSLKGSLAQQIEKQARIVYGNLYYGYYTDLIWAEFLTFSIIVIDIGLLLASFVSSSVAVIIIIMTVIVVMAIWNMTISKMKDFIKKRKEECEIEFPNVVSKLSLLINSGMVLNEAWNVVANGREGELYTLMQKTCDEINNGVSEQVAFSNFGVMSDSTIIKKFTSVLIQGLIKGNSELADFLTTQASELWNYKRQVMLQKGEIAAGKLIIPLGIMFGGIIMIVVTVSMQSMSF